MQSILHHRGKPHALTSDHWQSFITAEKFDAVIFDCDGTLIDSADVHLQCLMAGTQDQGHEMSPEWYAARNGLDRISLFDAFRQSFDATFDVERACQISIAQYDQAVHRARPIRETIALAKTLRDGAMPLAVATNGERPVCELLLATVNIRDLFDTVVCISDGVPPKPSPAIFQLAADQLGQEHSKVLVIEDSPQGVQAAKAAGMSVIQLCQPTH
ncbi:HAD family phosphatase [uncultured Tateyamaria sp.]|uniref:HAD family hydrolase n=1 Tax=uncultured Tateyamaria sp. TaxID=455651 RepID=UPI002615C2B8|nr:HAD family phosphatase [uncultured Tateyamaria sp.]